VNTPSDKHGSLLPAPHPMRGGTKQPRVTTIRQTRVIAACPAPDAGRHEAPLRHHHQANPGHCCLPRTRCGEARSNLASTPSDKPGSLLPAPHPMRGGTKQPRINTIRQTRVIARHEGPSRCHPVSRSVRSLESLAHCGPPGHDSAQIPS
jgi:hypothetical protein